MDGWEIGQSSLKPNIGWYYDTSDSRWYRDDAIWPLPDTALFLPTDRYEILARIAEARSRALGAEGNTGGAINGSVDLNVGSFGYGLERHEHSAQFRSINMRRYSFWERLLDEFGFSND